MAKVTKVCRVCGCSYEACHTLKPSDGTFRWQDVACSPEHGNVYLEQILASRAQKAAVKEPAAEEAVVEEPATVENTEEVSEPEETVKVTKRRRSKKDDAAE